MSATNNDVVQSFGWLEHQRILFIGAFATGTIGVLTLRMLGFGIIVTSIFTLSIMTLYMISGVSRKFMIKPDLLGDNLYYLGFLFTLVSMAYSLYSLGVKKSDINAILENFGLAISTTLYGLALRVFFNQNKSGIDEYESAVRMSMTDAAATLIGEMSKIGRDVATLRTTFSQSIDETLSAQKNSLEEMGKINKKFLSESVNFQREMISTLFKDLTDNQTKFLKNSIEIQTQDLNKLNQFITNKQIEMDRTFQTEFGKIANEMVNSLSLVKESVVQFTAEAKKFAPATSKVLKEFDKFSTHSETINENLVIPLSTITNVITHSSERLFEISESLELMNKSVNEITSDMPIFLENLNTKYKTAVNSQIQFYDSIKDFLDGSVHKLALAGEEQIRASAVQSSIQSNASLIFKDSTNLYSDGVVNIINSFGNLEEKISELNNSLINLKHEVQECSESLALNKLVQIENKPPEQLAKET
jgi:hypothetical protein